MRLKDILRPVKHALVGKQRIYKVIEVIGELERRKEQKVLTIFDVGAAIGEAALPMAKGFANARIYCFEPLPDSFERLKNRTQNFSDRIDYFNFGLYNKNGRINFYVFPHRDASSAIAQQSEGVSQTSIPVRRLDDVVEELEIKKIDFMKVDVEGAEKEVLEGGLKTLQNCVDNVFVEISPLRKGKHSHDYIDVFEYLHKSGFSFAGVYEDFFFTKLL